MGNWKVKSNAESGEGYSDIIVEIEDKEIGIGLELKYAELRHLMRDAEMRCSKSGTKIMKNYCWMTE